MKSRLREGERGVALLEVLVSIALASIVIFGIATAVLSALSASAHELARQHLSDDALNVLADIRAATAYDAAPLKDVVGRSFQSTLQRDGQTIFYVISVTRAAPKEPVAVSVTATDQTGAQAVERQEIFAEAPAPGSTVDAPPQTPLPRLGPGSPQ